MDTQLLRHMIRSYFEENSGGFSLWGGDGAAEFARTCAPEMSKHDVYRIVYEEFCARNNTPVLEANWQRLAEVFL